MSRRLDALRSGVAELIALEPTSVDPGVATKAHRELVGLADQIKVFAARLLALVESDGRWAAPGGSRTFPEWVARERKSSMAAARQDAMLGRALEDFLPQTSRAAATGEISLEHAQVLARFAPTSEARRAALASDLPDRNEQYLLRRAQSMGADEFRKETKRWAARVDQAAHEREHEASCSKEHLHLTRRPDGMSLAGFLTIEHGTVLETALRSVAGVPAADDERPPEQRRAAALTGLAQLVLDKGLSGVGCPVRPHLSVHVSWETMKRLAAEHREPADSDHTDGVQVPPAELDSGEPIPPSVLARITCDSEISRIVFGPAGQVLDVGRAQRTYTGSLRRAVIARDRRCQYPDCGAPPTLGEVHHVRPWSSGGETSVRNGVLLCWYHHELLHRRHLRIWRGQHGSWEFRRSDGTPLAGVSPGDGTPLAGVSPGDGTPLGGVSPGDGPSPRASLPQGALPIAV